MLWLTCMPPFNTFFSDPRFPNTNQSQHCWTRYNEWILCTKKSGADSAACTQARTFMRGICPDEWVERWDEEREEGKFAGLQ